MTIEKFLQDINKELNEADGNKDRLKISFSVANARSDYRTDAFLEKIEVDEEDGHIYFLLRKVT